MDSIMQYTDGLVTMAATFWFAVTFLTGVWASARYGLKTLLPSIVLAVLVMVCRVNVAPLSLVAIASMCGLHVASGVWLGLLLNRRAKSAPVK